LRTALNSPEAFTIEAAAAAVATSSSASERNELSRSSTIDEAIEAVIANQIESLVNGSQTDHHTA
uniref:Methyl-accepting chemotaxis protein n=1 Tax=Gongylonema pulchrum TaxID=637853 RepID=A0A183D3H4_9BILA